MIDYSSFCTSMILLEAIEELSESDLEDKKSDAYLWWINGGDEDKIKRYLDEYHPVWRNSDYLNWGDGVLVNEYFENKCSVCGEFLVMDNGFMSCPEYIIGDAENSDEHTSIEIVVK